MRGMLAIRHHPNSNYRLTVRLHFTSSGSQEVIAMRTLRTLFCFFMAGGVSFVFVDSAAAIRILMHGRDPGATFRDDLTTFMHLESVFGAENVDYLQGALAAADGSSANGYDVLYLSSTMASSVLRDKYEDSPVGIVNSENALIHDNNTGNFMLSDSAGNQDMINGKDKINIVNSSHPLAAGLSGEVTVYKTTVANWWQHSRGSLAPGVIPIAESLLDNVAAPGDYNGNGTVDAADYVLWRHGGPLSNEEHTSGTVSQEDYTEWRARFGNTPQQHAIVAADVGAQLLGDGSPGRPATAAGRRVFFFVSDFGSFDLTEDGFKLFDAAIQWAAEDPPAPTVGSGVSAVPEPASMLTALVAAALLLAGSARVVGRENC
jgi:hypothetical protein